MHAFDLDKFEDSRIVAVMPWWKIGDFSMVKERELTTEDIVITVALTNQLP